MSVLRVLHEILFAPVLMYGSETMLWSPRIKDVQMGNLRGLLGIRRTYRVPNRRINEL